jgi:hypothetical protein
MNEKIMAGMRMLIVLRRVLERERVRRVRL